MVLRATADSFELRSRYGLFGLRLERGYVQFVYCWPGEVGEEWVGK